MRRVGPVLVVWLAGCGGHGAPDAAVVPDAALESFDQPDISCPGGPTCQSAGDGVLKVGAAAHAWTPTGFETYTDTNNNNQYDMGEPFMDLNGNGKFDGVWLFGGGRAAKGVTTDVEARAIALVQGDTTVVILYNDCVGLLGGDMDMIRGNALLAGYSIDHIIIGSTHAHDAPDTVGLWGPDPFTTGREPFVLQALYDADAHAIKDAIDAAKPAHMIIASTKLVNDPANPMAGTSQWNLDYRDPVIYDPTLTIARFVDATDETKTLGTIVNWGNHPEVAHFSKTEPAQITAHYPHWVRQHVETGVRMTEAAGLTADLPGLGGVTVFVQGALGGQVGSLADHQVAPLGPDGQPILDDSNAKDAQIGTNVAMRALQALATSGEHVTDLPLTLQSAKYWARMDNVLLQTAFLVHLLGPHDAAGYDPSSALGQGNAPWLSLRATYLQIGPLGLVTVPGELHPELWVGGYDGSWSWGNTLYDPSKPNPPRMADAPKPPYMRDLVLAKPGVKYPVVAGLAEDYIGYIVPAYNYDLDPNNPYITRAAGEHYEEVYSLGPLVEEHAIHPILKLLQIAH